MNWFRRFLRALRVLRPVRHSGVNEPWTREDAQALRSFLTSPSGIRLGAALRNRLAIVAQDALYDRAGRNFAWECGHAAGMHTAVAYLDSLAAEQDPAPTADDRPSDSLDWLEPHTKTEA